MRLVLAGFGVVGQSFAQLLLQKKAELLSSYGMVPRIVAVIDSSSAVTDERGIDIPKVIRIKKKSGSVGRSAGAVVGASSRGAAGRGGGGDATSHVIREVEADVLVETTSTNFRSGEPGLGHMRAAFISKKHVVTSNKGPLGVAFRALHELARHNGVQFRYSGAVGGGTPILDFGRTCSIGDEITEVRGILNGTCNFILTKMEREGLGFGDALKLAQKEGYAETDPTQDIEGYDSAVKLVIIANHLRMSDRATVRDVEVKGIAGLSPAEVSRAGAEGKAVRLIATARAGGKEDDGGGGLSVAPATISKDDPLCISGPYNAVRFDCRYSGPKVIVGKGAGGPETASSLLRDLIEIRGGMGTEVEL